MTIVHLYCIERVEKMLADMSMLVHCQNDDVATVIAQEMLKLCKIFNFKVEKLNAYINSSFTAIDYLLDNFRYQWP